MPFAIEELVDDAAYFARKSELVPAPDSCKVCGNDKRNHGMLWTRSLEGFHLWIEPDNALRLKRMKARREQQ